MWLSDALSSKRTTKPYSEPIQTVLTTSRNRTWKQPKPYSICTRTQACCLFPSLWGSQENLLKIDAFPFSDRTRNRTRTAADLRGRSLRGGVLGLVAHDCGNPVSRYTCRATRVAADFLDFIAFCRCSTGVALHPLKILVSHLAPPPVPGGVAPKFGSEKVSRYTGVSQLQLRVSRYTVQLRF